MMNHLKRPCNPNSILIIKNIKIEMNDGIKYDEQEYFPVMVRFYNGKSIGYPLKVFITNETTVEMMISHFISKMDDKLSFVGCVSKRKEFKINDIISEAHGKHNTLKLLLKFK